MIKKYECSSCGATIDFPDEAEKVTCEFCGTVHYRELSQDEKDKKNALATANKVKAYKSNLVKYINKSNSMNIAKHTYERTITDQKELIPLIIFTCVFIWIGVCGAVGGGLSFLTDYSILLYVLICVLTAIGSGTGLVFGGLFFKNKKEIDYATKLTENKKKYEAAKKDFEAFAKTFNIEYISDIYRNETALNYFIKVLGAQKAVTLQQAINLYEDKIEKEEEFTTRQQQIDELKELQAQNAEISKNNNSNANDLLKGVIAGTAVTAGTVVAKKVAKDVIKNFFD